MGTSAPGEEGSLPGPCLGYGSGRGCLGVDGHHVCVKELPTKKTARRQDRTRRADTDPVTQLASGGQSNEDTGHATPWPSLWRLGSS